MLHVIFTRENITIALAGYMINHAFLPPKKLSEVVWCFHVTGNPT